MKFSKILLSILVVFSPVLAFSQSNYQKGLIVTTKGDTVRGYVDLKEWGNNPSDINFKTSLDKPSPQVLTVADISYFQVNKITAYKRFTTSISLDETNDQRIKTGRDTSSKTDIVFLKELQKGSHVTLYSYRDDLKERFFVYESQNGSLAELIYRVYYVPNDKNNVTTSTQEAYKQQLLLIAEKLNTYNANIRALIENAGYYRSDLEFICRKINDSKEEGVVDKEHKSFRYFAGAGADYGSINITGAFPLYNLTPLTSIGPLISAGFNYYPVPQIGKSVLRLEAIYSINSFKGTGGTFYVQPAPKSTYSVKQNNLSIIPQFQYNVYNSDPFKWYLDFGFAFNLSTYSDGHFTASDGTVTSANFGLDPQWLSIPVKSGVILNKKLEISLSYSFPVSISDQISGDYRNYDYSFKLQTVQLSLNYIL